MPIAAPDSAPPGIEIAAIPQLADPKAAASPMIAPIREKSNHRGKFIVGPKGGICTGRRQSAGAYPKPYRFVRKIL
jgi:hypothetical protein